MLHAQNGSSAACSGDGPGFGSYFAYSYSEDAVIIGCTDINACNFAPEFTIDDGSCIYTGDVIIPPTSIPDAFDEFGNNFNLLAHPGCELITQGCHCCRDYDDIDQFPFQLNEYSCEEAVNLYGCDYLFGGDSFPLGAFCQLTCYGCVLDTVDINTFIYIDMVNESITNYLQINYDSLNAHLGTNYASPN